MLRHRPGTMAKLSGNIGIRNSQNRYRPVWLSVIDGRVVVENGRIPGLDLDALVEQHNQQAAR